MLKRLRSARFLVVFAALWIAVTIVLAGWILADMWASLRTLTWARTDGTITDRYVEAEQKDDQWLYGARVAFRYKIDGTEYTANNPRIIPEPIRSTRERAYQDIEKYSGENSVPVYYNPRRPQEAVLKRGPALEVLLLWAGLIVSCAAAIAYIVRACRNAKPIKSSMVEHSTL